MEEPGTAPSEAGQSANAALQAFERLTIGPDVPDKSESSLPLSRPSSSHTVTSFGAHADTPKQPQPLRRASSSFASSPSISKRLSSTSLKGPQSPASPRFPTSRRSSSNLPLRPASQNSIHGPVPGETEPFKPPTAASVATDYFAKELAAQEGTTHGDAETLVIIHEACYGHRFSRPKTSKAALSTIVERPERITAAVLGLSTAYVRLGSRHAGGSAPPTPGEEHGKKPPFAIRRTLRSVGLLSPPVVAVHGLDWMHELQTMCLAAGARLAMDGRELLRPTKLDSMGRPVESAQFHEGDLYLCAESLEALQGAVGGVCDAVDAVFAESITKRAFVAVRPPGHHCSADFPSGFCWLNNVHVGIQHAAHTYGLTHAVILDFDLHHGDGSQDITWNINERSQAMPKNAAHSKKISIGYYSLHDINSYPCESGDKEKVQNASLCIDNAHGQSIWNVHLEPWSSEADFLRLYETKYAVIFDKARLFLQKQTERIQANPKGGKPRAAVFISAGFDASQWEGAGMQRHAVNVPTSFYERFTKDAVKLAQDESSAAEGRVISVLEGGYSNRALTSGVLSHISGLCQPVSSSVTNGHARLQEAMGIADSVLPHMPHLLPSDPRWWNSEALNALETYETAEVALPKKVRSGFVPTFASPTESFSNKVVDQDKFHRSMSGTMRPLPEIVDMAVPDVDWVAASHALCKVLVPSHRSTTSCKPEDLAVVRSKKPRQSMAMVPPPIEAGSNGRQLRDRKAKPLVNGLGGVSEDESMARPSNRRKTMDAPTMQSPSSATAARKTHSRGSSIVSGSDATSNAQYHIPAVPLIPPAGARSVPSTPMQPLIAKKVRKSPTKAVPSSKTSTPAPKAGSVAQRRLEATRISDSVATTPPSLKTESSTASYETAPSSAGDMDSLTTAVKRITLKVGTREEHDKRIREQQEVERTAKAEARRKAVRKEPTPQPKKATPVSTPAPAPMPMYRPAGVAKSMTARSPQRSTPNAQTPTQIQSKQQPSPMLAPATPVTAPNTIKPYPEPSSSVPPPPAQEQQEPTPSSIPAQAVPITSLLNSSATPLHPSTQQLIPDSAARQLQSEHATAAAAAYKRTYNVPPVFTSTGAIPFAPPSEPAAPAVADTAAPMMESENDIGVGNGVSRSMLRPEDISAPASVVPSPSPFEEGEGWLGRE
ncbi:hypothetical protein ANO11243_029710 [Dothideomycetidae sp. 11243]|nr:hypothetical protein ANO11243_029710 [fungal sp. No.11243]